MILGVFPCGWFTRVTPRPYMLDDMASLVICFAGHLLRWALCCALTFYARCMPKMGKEIKKVLSLYNVRTLVNHIISIGISKKLICAFGIKWGVVINVYPWNDTA